MCSYNVVLALTLEALWRFSSPPSKSRPRHRRPQLFWPSPMSVEP